LKIVTSASQRNQIRTITEGPNRLPKDTEFAKSELEILCLEKRELMNEEQELQSQSPEVKCERLKFAQVLIIQSFKWPTGRKQE